MEDIAPRTVAIRYPPTPVARNARPPWEKGGRITIKIKN